MQAVGPLPLTKDHCLLLLFKDDLPLKLGRGFPLTTQSRTILRHRAITDPEAARELQAIEGTGTEAEGGSADRTSVTLQVSQMRLFPFPEESRTDPLWPAPPPEDCCVWGWWRKPWESHPALFAQIQNYLTAAKIMDVLLYNQYTRWIYNAKLHGVYFREFLTSVRIPQTWFQACPAYYRDEPRVCGAFLLLQIEEDPHEDTSALLAKLFVDSASFEVEPNCFEMVIPPGESMRDVTSRMIDKPISRTGLRESDHTLVLLRSFQQRDRTRKLLETKGDVADDLLATAFAETEWSDMRLLLRTATPGAWAKLAQCPRTLEEIGIKARREGALITRFDMELVAWAFSSAKVAVLFVSKSGEEERFTNMGEALRRWATCATAAEARETAAAVFEASWDAAEERYEISKPSGHFGSLPALEAVASAVQHEIGGKFYRDHLSHNVRAGLLGARLADANCSPGPRGESAPYIAFFSGLLHDIALPVTSFPEIVGKLAAALTKLQLDRSSFRPQGIVETEFLPQSLNYVALLSSVPSVLGEYPDGCRPWENPDDAIAPADRRLLQELLLCAKAEDHAIISAAILFHRAVLARRDKHLESLDSGVRTLMMAMTGRAAKKEASEFLGILQCIALHDRKAALKFHPVDTFPRNAPAHLSWNGFAVPITVSVADECQEWGRPVGALEGMAIVDANASLTNGKLQTRYVWNTDAKTFANLPYSLLHMLFGKLRFCRAFRRGQGSDDMPLDLVASLESLEAFRMAYVAFEEFRISFGPKVLSLRADAWPEERTSPKEYRGGKNQHLISVCLADGKGQAHDYLVVDGDAAVCKELASAAEDQCCLQRITLDGWTFDLECKGGRRFEGQLTECYFGEIEEASPTGEFPTEEGCSLFHLRMTPTAKISNTPLKPSGHGIHRLPHPHLLDLDWRFTERSAKWIAAAARRYAGDAEICYLGCPTVALYHHLMFPSDGKWRLLDRGHFALTQWLDDKLLPEGLCKPYYDVFGALPQHLRGRFAVVITDPPWYRDEYEKFCRRAAQLAAPGGLVFLSSYPPYRPYKAEKHYYFEHIVKTELSDPNWIGSMEIDYEVPEFELAWDGQMRYQHSGLGVYRPAYLDVFRTRGSRAGANHARPPEVLLPRTEVLSNGHHMRCSEKLSFPCTVRVSRHESIRRVALGKDVVAWATRNAVVRTDGSAGKLVHDFGGLVALVEEWERGEKPGTRRKGTSEVGKRSTMDG